MFFSVRNTKRQLLAVLKDESGQLLVYVLAAVVVASVVTFGVAYRSLTSIRKSGFSAQSVESLHAAESCAESALALDDTDLQDIIDNQGGGPINISLDVTDDDPRCEYSVAQDGGSPTLASFTIDKDEVREINLEGYAGDELTIYWDRLSSSEDALLLLRVVYTSGADYEVVAYLMDGDDDNDCDTAGVATPPDAGDATYAHRVTFGTTIPALPSNTVLLRIRPLCTPTTVRLVNDGVNDFPSQGYVINTTGWAGESVRNVRVVRGRAQLPAIFDYALFSKSETIPLSK